MVAGDDGRMKEERRCPRLKRQGDCTCLVFLNLFHDQKVQSL